MKIVVGLHKDEKNGLKLKNVHDKIKTETKITCLKEKGTAMNKKKLPYEDALLEIVKLQAADVISTSDPKSPYDPEGDMDDAWV